MLELKVCATTTQQKVNFLAKNFVLGSALGSHLCVDVVCACACIYTHVLTHGCVEVSGQRPQLDLYFAP